MISEIIRRCSVAVDPVLYKQVVQSGLDKKIAIFTRGVMVGVSLGTAIEWGKKEVLSSKLSSITVISNVPNGVVVKMSSAPELTMEEKVASFFLLDPKDVIIVKSVFVGRHKVYEIHFSKGLSREKDAQILNKLKEYGFSRPCLERSSIGGYVTEISSFEREKFEKLCLTE